MADDPNAEPKPKPAVPVPPIVPIPPDVEVGGRSGPEPTRYGDWEKKGIAVDF
jgi:hypothetical protein